MRETCTLIRGMDGVLALPTQGRRHAHTRKADTNDTERN